MASATTPPSVTPSPTTAKPPPQSRKNDKNFRHRRKHKNSKLGCPNCKKRRVKCSEDLPSCTNCIKHLVKCGYLDYSEEQLEELRQSKLDNQFDELSTGEPASPGELLVHTALLRSKSRSESDASESTAATTARSSVATSARSSSNPLYATTNAPYAFPQHAVTQVFDNLLSKAHTDETIIYPLYSLNNTTEPASDANPYFLPTRDVFNSSAGAGNGGSIADVISSQNLSQRHSPLNDTVAIHSVSPSPVKGLPGAKQAVSSFVVLPKRNINYSDELVRLLKANAPTIASGTASLANIRNIYVTWLNSFVFSSYTSEIMFSCLVNLTTNYLISNCFGDYPTYKQAGASLPYYQQHHQVRKYSRLAEKSRLKNTAIVKSIRHYARVIKELRILLNKNSDPLVCSSISYILSLMAIYDPEATLNSITCFRDGLFLILGYNINLLIKNNTQIHMLIPVHLRLMKNIVRSIYLPSYDPTFLTEFHAILLEFAAAAQAKIDYVNAYNSSQSLPHNDTLEFVQLKAHDLIIYVEKTINEYLPTIAANLTNVDIQQEVLFEMVSKWVRLNPSKLTVVNHATEPLEKVLYLFYKVWKKALFAVLPQVKFFFLRDFDSPIMLDVFNYTKDTDIYFHELDVPKRKNLPDDLYHDILPLLKSTSAYLIRILTFLQLRLHILYRKIVYEEYSQNKFPIDDIKQWKESITDIEETRRQFNKVIGLHEVPIRSFHKTAICPYHYPSDASPDLDADGDLKLGDESHGPVDLGQFLPSGLFAADYDINI
ncbi:uncharacterized protein CANTADRAFT_5207 [Suhomyces tanzawaensis NRRL Y-17324]|uniref:Zn(2)-C6 fungal-type domain-containing protein n=1 Tax=Suhomyces tanzawaensis NRRL Y-17324 TaxID=984487 RepID=A0A1E4SNZ8_9ASCO|nr:uncharacterized protein CANTADRAFT_5207 [Suhomyces tanzawaensis NRRL Y-17324]ODV81251.1 hypothetical protein CANTADRAFT_5207 [Suhomyces tanzawaensis NRRL Y-17324]